MPEKNIAIRIDEELHKRIKMRLIQNGMSLKDYIIYLIEKDLNEPIDLKAIPFDETVSQETINEAQKVLDFVSNVMNGKYSNEKK